ncbi:lipoamide acyltransferase component of branched-chain alpha-keto acid dehydrogenase complex, mitochondrial isoform X3 [Leptopilina boulardi]|uniref:lipoamide acyltransferase component of branched-chain alpha-keto acid dehydrogenase complex, mitochondrial isoform X2 n=1 Tax=Leptopilina boulardi TaxID=63433 RepID=UPI0021F60D31|nr:lipoamide acyltransferase component of branched-chain alpha-keto acid dehydrogenase complex, mitochondrial isoform X2 [Leptopilina boulardi]XP_051164150.1 lipoamide acyltransferase component of branched-chain alpha-keto acid dehydrogenase complex, mitochondrial isoform X3 [Leptopilina boulardi]
MHRAARYGCLQSTFAKSCRFIVLSSFRQGKIVPYKLTDIGEGIREVTVKEWFVKVGDKVAQFDNICEVQSDKASVTITSRYDGLVKALHYKIDDIALVGNPLVDIELVNEEFDNEFSQEKNIQEPKKNQIIETSSNVTRDDITNVENLLGKVLATPAVRRIALENKINLKDVTSTGRDGRVLKEDILAHIKCHIENSNDDDDDEKKNPLVNVTPVKGYAKHMWKTMTKALTIPHFTYSDDCDVTKLIRCREEVKDALKKEGISLTYMPFFVKAASEALKEFPQLNGWLDDESESVKMVKHHNISIAMDTPQGLIVPNIKNVQNLSIVNIAKELNRLQELGKKSSIPLNDISDGTFCLSNIGTIGGTYMKPVILSPQIVIGAVGKIQKLPRFGEGNSVIAVNLLSVSWSADHRVVDGVTMAKFSNQWKHYVENPLLLALGK